MSTVSLLCKSRYRTPQAEYLPGRVYEVTEAHAAFLMADSPGSFVVQAEPEAKAFDAPPVDKMVKRTRAKVK